MNFASDETERGTKSAIIVSNATARTVFVEMEAIETVRKGNTQAIDLGIGVDAGTTNFAGTTVEVRLDQGGDVKVRGVKSFLLQAKSMLLEKELLDARTSTVHAHSTWNIPLPGSCHHPRSR